MPARADLSNFELSEMYNTVKETVLAELNKATSVSLTTDVWTSRATQGYITVTCHYIDLDWKIRNYVLQTRILEEKHNGENIGNVLVDCMTEWNIRDKVTAVVTDNAANMAVAARTAGINTHIACFAHTLNLAAKKGLKQVETSNTLPKLRKIATYFHKSTTASAVLRHKQALCDINKNKLKIDVSTRWNSTYDMIERFLEQKEAVTAALCDAKLKKDKLDSVTDSELEELEALKIMLQPFKEATLTMCSQKSPTVSVINPMTNLLKTSFEPADTDTQRITDSKAVMKRDMQNRYTHPEIRTLLLCATFLDPRFKTLRDVDAQEKSVVFGKVIQLAASAFEKTAALQEPPVLTHETEEPPKKLQKMSAMSSFFGSYYEEPESEAGENSVDPAVNKAEEEIAQYKMYKPISVDDDPLQWWRLHEGQFPLLATVARSMLAIPGTSVPSERVFSTAGDIITANRACLKWHKVDKMLFLKMNMP